MATARGEHGSLAAALGGAWPALPRAKAPRRSCGGAGANAAVRQRGRASSAVYLGYSCKSPKCFCSVSKGPSAAEQPALGYLAALPVPGAFCIVRKPLRGGGGKTQLSFVICNRLLTFLAPTVAAFFFFLALLALPSRRSALCFEAATPPPCFGRRWKCPDAISRLREVRPALVAHPEPPSPQVKRPPVFPGTGALPTPPSPRRQPPASPHLSPPQNDFSGAVKKRVRSGSELEGWPVTDSNFQ